MKFGLQEKLSSPMIVLAMVHVMVMVARVEVEMAGVIPVVPVEL